MSYVSVLKNIPELLSQPAGIAAIASVGIHGAIAFILPLMPVDSKPKEKTSPASVGILELSQAEQNRLPQKKNPLVSGLPLTPQQPALTLPKFATKPTPLDKLALSPNSTKVILPPLPKSSVNPSILSVPKSRSLPILRQPNFNSSFNAKAKSGASYRSFNPKISPVSRGGSKLRTSATSTLPNIPPIQPAPIPQGLSSLPVPPPLSGNQNSGIGVNGAVAVNPVNSPGNSGVAVNQPGIDNSQNVLAPANRSIPKPGDKLTLAGQSLPRWESQQGGARRIELPKQQPANQNIKVTPGNTRTLALAKQFEEVKIRYPNSEVKTPISQVITTKPGKEGKVEGTLVVDSDGKVDYFKVVDKKSISSHLREATKNYFRSYIRKNRDSIRRNGKPKVYAFTLDFRSDKVNAAESSKPQKRLVNSLRSSKNQQTQLNQKPSTKQPANNSRVSEPVKINVQPAPGKVVVPTGNSAPVKLKPQVEVEMQKKPASTSGNTDNPGAVKIRTNQEVPKVPAKPKPEARVNTQKPISQTNSKPSIANRLRSDKKESENNTQKTSDSKKNLIERLLKAKQERQSSN